VIPAIGGTARQITLDGGGSPTWSPDGSQIAFVSGRSGNSDIWVIDVDPPIAFDQQSWGSVKGKYHE
jgi:Tol biopolymer transport system component